MNLCYDGTNLFWLCLISPLHNTQWKLPIVIKAKTFTILVNFIITAEDEKFHNFEPMLTNSSCV